MNNTLQKIMDSLARFIPFALSNIQYPRPDLAFYSTGESDHWAVQSSLNICGVFAVASEYPEIAEKTGLTQEKLRETALALFRYALHTHATGDFPSTGGKQWGCHWISVLGLERMTHAVNLLEKYMTENDLARMREMRLEESRWLLHEYPAVAAPDNASHCNKPESNMWNGGFLLRTAADYPDDPESTAFRKKGILFILNAICRESDMESEELFDGKPRKEWQVGGNFTPNWSLDHHGYMNVGYSVVTLSNLAMLHYNFLARNQQPEKVLYTHAEELWKVVKQFIFPDGRLMRIGGDTRARYTYCQAYLLPVLVFARDFFQDPDAEEMAEKYMELIFREQSVNGDGSYYGKRLAELRREGYYYYMRLESDPALVLSQYLTWTKEPVSPMRKSRTDCIWHDEFHNAVLLRRSGIVRSFVQAGGQGPTLLCLPENESSLAEWQGSGFAEVVLHREKFRTAAKWQKLIPEGFIVSGTTYCYEKDPTGEGESSYDALLSRSAAAALPDGKSMIVLEYAEVVKDFTFHRSRTAALKIPNDVYNDYVRNYSFGGGSVSLYTLTDPTLIDTQSRNVTIGNSIALHAVYGIDSWKIDHPAEQEIKLERFTFMRSLYADTVCGHRYPDCQRFRKGTVFADTGYVISADSRLTWTSRRLETSGMVRAVEVSSSEGTLRQFAVNFGNTDARWNNIIIPAGQAVLR